MSDQSKRYRDIRLGDMFQWGWDNWVGSGGEIRTGDVLIVIALPPRGFCVVLNTFTGTINKRVYPSDLGSYSNIVFLGNIHDKVEQ